jgi:hypothetical protein
LLDKDLPSSISQAVRICRGVLQSILLRFIYIALRTDEAAEIIIREIVHIAKIAEASPSLKVLGLEF